jgi:HK97 family phage major capsid protein
VKITDLIARLRGDIAAKLEERNGIAEQLEQLRDDETTDEAKVAELRASKADIDAIAARVSELEAEQAADEAATRLAASVTAAPGIVRDDKPATVRVGQEARTYRPDNDRSGKQFLLDVARTHLGIDPAASERLARHMTEEHVERAEFFQRAAGTGAFAGLVVPQYLTDLYAPAAKASRPFADICNPHDLPPEGMVVNISRITTATSTAVQSSENSAVSETNIDDTLLSPAVQTAAGQQTVSRQAIERGTGVEDVTLDDLFRSFASTLDSTLITQATNGLSAVATSVAYTDVSPTTAELYPKVLEALSGVEGALLDQDPGDNVAVMHSRRWYWMQNSVGSTWPFVQQPGIAPQMFAANFAEAYGSGFRGVLPNGTPVIVDNNIATNLGAGTNEDEIYLVSRRECHLWEDPTAPMLIRAEQTAAATLGVLLVVYGYFAYTHARYAHARKIAGTGLVTPTFTGA